MCREFIANFYEYLLQRLLAPRFYIPPLEISQIFLSYYNEVPITEVLINVRWILLAFVQKCF